MYKVFEKQIMSSSIDQKIREKLIMLLEARGVSKTICPSEVVRKLYPTTWRDYMPKVRSIGCQLYHEGVLDVMQKGVVVDPATSKGPIRCRLRHAKVKSDLS